MINDVQISLTGFKLPGIFGADSAMMLDTEIMKAEKLVKTGKVTVTEK